MTDTVETQETAESTDELAGLKKKNRDLIQVNKTLKSEMDALKAKLDEIQSGLEETQARKETDIEKALAARDKKYSGEIEKLSTREKALMKTLEAKLIDGEAVTAINNADGIAKLLLPHVKRRLRVVEQDGEFRTEILDQDGNPSEMTVAELIAEYRADSDFSGAFRASGVAVGTGAKPSSSLTVEENPYVKGSTAYSLTAQAALEKQDPTRAAALKAAAASSSKVSSRTGLRPLKR
jgi:regulator of replication initiation timing